MVGSENQFIVSIRQGELADAASLWSSGIM
jgi:hypothetical protein